MYVSCQCMHSGGLPRKSLGVNDGVTRIQARSSSEAVHLDEHPSMFQVAAEALQALAAESEEIRPKIATAGCIKPLIQMLQIGTFLAYRLSNSEIYIASIAA